MAGIVVSGGTYSGSGDVTTDWFVCDDTATNTVYMPDGVIDCISENASNYTFRVGNTTYFYHQDGTIRISNPDDCYIYMRGKSGLSADRYPWNVDIRAGDGKRVGHGASSGWDILNDLTLNCASASGGCYSRQGGDIRDLTVIGDVLLTTGTLQTHEIGDSTVPTCTFGSLHIQADGIYDATSGSTYINWNNSLYSVIYRNSGIMIHNSGTIVLNPNTSTVFGGGGGTGGLWNVIATEDGGNPTYRVYSTPIIENDLTISGTLTYNNNLAGGQSHTVSGNVMLASGASYANTGVTAQTQTFGSLFINEGTTFIASPSGNTILTNKRSETSVPYQFYCNGTLTHNNGTFKDTFNDTSHRWAPASDQFFYNVIIDTTAGWTRFEGGDLNIANDLTVTSGVLLQHAEGGTLPLLVSGTALISNGGQIGGRNDAGAYTFGALDNQSGGIYDATSGTTTLKGNFTQAGTFTHNSGTVEIAANCELLPTNYIRPYGDPITFYDVTHSAGIFYVERPVVFENSYTKSASQEVRQYAEATFGTADAAGTMTINSGSWMLYGSYDDPVLMGASEIYPAIITGAVTDPIDWGSVDSTTRNTYNYLKWIDVKKDAVTGGGTTSGARFVLSGNCQFAGLEISTKDDFNVNGFRLECSDELDINGGTIRTADSLLVLHGGIDNDGSWYTDSSCDMMISGGTGWMDAKVGR